MDTQANSQTPPDEMLIQLTSDIVSAYVKNHNVPTENIPALIRDTFAALSSPKAEEESSTAEKPVPAVPVSKSIDKKGEYIVCLEDGLKFKSMKRHLTTAYKMTPEEYRRRWGLPSDYPMVAPVYAERRSRLAREMGLGRKSTAA